MDIIKQIKKGATSNSDLIGKQVELNILKMLMEKRTLDIFQKHIEDNCIDIEIGASFEKVTVVHFICYSGKLLRLLDLILKSKKVVKKQKLPLFDKAMPCSKSGHTVVHLACIGLHQKVIEKLIL